MKIYIGGISPEVTENELQDLYSQYGKVKKVDLLKDEAGVNRGYAFIEMDDEMAGESAILGTNNTLLGGTNIQVSVSRSRLDQKRERQQKRKMDNKFKNNPKPARNNRVSDRQNPHQNHNNFDEDKFNRKPLNNNIQKGVDYGRNSSVGTPQMSFLGQDGFATSLRTVDPLYSSNGGNRRNSGPGSNYYKKGNNRRGNYNNNRNNYNNRNQGNQKNNNDKPESDSIFQPNTSDIIGNLE